jgi:hypothetical protein
VIREVGHPQTGAQRRCDPSSLEKAFERGHPDIESLKRYTGFATGWCQGKWCQALCARWLAERGGDPGGGITPRPPIHPAPLSALAGLDPDW